jgi:hypothetical protein
MKLYGKYKVVTEIMVRTGDTTNFGLISGMEYIHRSFSKVVLFCG